MHSTHGGSREKAPAERLFAGCAANTRDASFDDERFWLPAPLFLFHFMSTQFALCTFSFAVRQAAIAIAVKVIAYRLFALASSSGSPRILLRWSGLLKAVSPAPWAVAGRKPSGWTRLVARLGGEPEVLITALLLGAGRAVGMCKKHVETETAGGNFASPSASAAAALTRHPSRRASVADRSRRRASTSKRLSPDEETTTARRESPKKIGDAAGEHPDAMKRTASASNPDLCVALHPLASSLLCSALDCFQVPGAPSKSLSGIAARIRVTTASD